MQVRKGERVMTPMKAKTITAASAEKMASVPSTESMWRPIILSSLSP